MNKASESCSVTFEPFGVRVEVPCGVTIQEAANEAGIYISSICGGDGVCGKCRVIIEEGEVESEPTDLLTRNEIKAGYVLACLTKVRSPVVVRVPEESRLDTQRILVDREAHRFSAIESRALASTRFAYGPLVHKVFLELSPPTVDNNLPDHERVYQALRRRGDFKELQTGYQILRQLPVLLRQANWRITATLARRGAVTEVVQYEAGDRSARNFGLAVDVGTTTVVAHLVNLSSGETVATEATYNSQMKFGEDYIRRIDYAIQNNALDTLQKCVVEDVNGLITELVKQSGGALADISCIMASGNTAMIHFLWGLDPHNIKRSPYIPTANHLPAIRAAQVGIHINGRGLLYCLPSVSAYVGSDVTAGVVATGIDALRENTLFVDIGTNGEIVIANDQWLVCASASAGPAFEGSGVKCGMRAVSGAIERVSFDGDGRVRVRTVGNMPPLGICGSGLLDALAELFCAGVITRSGRFDGSMYPERMTYDDDYGEAFVLAGAEESAHDAPIVLTQTDVLTLVRSKAGVYAAISTLMDAMHIRKEEISQVFLAGGFGNYLDARKAVMIGMLPDIPIPRIHYMGNTSVSGAKLCLMSEEAFRHCQEVAKGMTTFDLMTNADYMDEFIRANFLPHTDVELFPTVVAAGCGRHKERRQ
ncbi:MAG: ASKHA domain-containing protein [Planctomycetota bacterium]